MDSPHTHTPTPANSFGQVQERLDALAATDNWGVEAAQLLLEAVEQAGGSDLHLSCQRNEVVVRGRREGNLFPLARVPLERRDLLIARLKVLAHLPAFVRHEPQDGRIEWRPSPDAPLRLLRISFLPTIHGENVVIRFPEPGNRFLDLSSLGMPAPLLKALRSLLTRQEGTILLTGPSSSGKSTTMYAMLQHLNRSFGDRANILTIEDPVERDLGFAGQVQVNEPQGLSFERALRATLRQDPNVLMIGEMRDLETARIAVQAGMTGHLVISTLHAGRASRVFTRLLSMGIEPYLVASALTGIVAQRLARLLCHECRQADPHTGGYLPSGCPACAYTGYRGRTGIFELILVSEELRQMILSRATPAQIAAQASHSQLGELGEEAKRLLNEGEISQPEYEYLLASEEQG